MAKSSLPFLPGGGGSKPSVPSPFGAPPGAGGLSNSPRSPEFLKPGKKPPGGKGGQKAGVPNFKSRITKQGGMKKGGKVMAGQGSGVGRLQRSK